MKRLFSSLSSRTMKPRVLVLTGPTGIGKTSLSIDLAREIDAEIISADSVQIVKGMDVGSGKVVNTGGIVHHNLDVLESSERFSAYQFAERTQDLCDDILSRGKQVIITGGSGYYIRWFLYGGNAPQGDAKSEEKGIELCKRIMSEDFDKMAEELNLDEDAQTHVLAIKSSNNINRLNRMMEILYLTGGKLPERINITDYDHMDSLKYDFRCFFLCSEREWLWRRIENRCVEMVRYGLFKEILDLVINGFEYKSRRAMALGYRQTLEYFQLQVEHEILFRQTGIRPDISQRRKEFIYFLDKFQGATRRYAKQQMNLLHTEMIYKWINVTPNDISSIVDEKHEELSLTEEKIKQMIQNEIINDYNMSFDDYWNERKKLEHMEQQKQYRSLRNAHGNTEIHRTHQGARSYFSDKHNIDIFLKNQEHNYPKLLDFGFEFKP